MHVGPCTKTESMSQVQKLQAEVEHQAGQEGKMSSKGVSHETAGEHMQLDYKEQIYWVCVILFESGSSRSSSEPGT